MGTGGVEGVGMQRETSQCLRILTSAKNKLGIPRIFPFVFSSLATVPFARPLASNKTAKILFSNCYAN